MFNHLIKQNKDLQLKFLFYNQTVVFLRSDSRKKVGKYLWQLQK